MSTDVKRRIGIAAALLVAIASLLFVADHFYTHWERERDFYSAKDYPALRAACNQSIVSHFPASIPANATKVRIYAVGPNQRVLRVPDWMMEVRYFVPPTAAQAVEDSASTISKALATKPGSNQTAIGYVPDRLHTLDDSGDSTPIPAGFNSYIVANPGGSNVGGVTINAQTGEVIYWFFEF